MILKQKQKIEIFLNNFLNINLNNNQNKTEKNKTDLIGCGYRHCFFLNKSGLEKQDKLFLFGVISVNMNGRLGTDIDLTFLKKTKNFFINSFTFSKIKKFKIGEDHNLILFENGDLLSFGDNYYGQCGFSNNEEYILTPRKIDFVNEKNKIKDIFCSMDTSYILLENNELYSFGRNKCGECGIDSEERLYYIPEKIKIPEHNIKNINFFTSSKSGYCFLLINKNILYGFGHNFRNILGGGTNIDIIRSPIKINNKFKKIKNIFCGDFRYYILGDKKLYGMGLNHHGQVCVEGNSNFIFVLKKIDSSIFNNLKIKKISLNAYSTILLTKNPSKVFSWGYNNYGELGNGTYENNTTIQEIEFFKNLPPYKKIVDISSGIFYSLALSKNNEIYFWGQCGDMNYNIPTKIYNI